MSRLYNELLNEDNNDIKINFTSDTLNDRLKIFLERFYLDLHNCLDENMKEYISKNQNLYDRTIMMKTSDVFGYYWIKTSGDNISISNIIKNFCETLDECIEKENTLIEKYDSDIPVEFLDPIMSTPIINPVELPSSKTIVEKETIENHLVFSQTDPFNRADLTLDILNDHNMIESTKDTIDNFKNDFDKWKSTHRM